MADATENYWPPEIIDAADPEPVAILKEQAALLGGRTNNAVEAVVKTSTEAGTAYHSLYLKADALGDYLYKLLDIAHPVIGRVGDYPITVQSFGGRGPEVDLEGGGVSRVAAGPTLFGLCPDGDQQLASIRPRGTAGDAGRLNATARPVVKRLRGECLRPRIQLLEQGEHVFSTDHLVPPATHDRQARLGAAPGPKCR